jgi:hypothetical protein
MDGTSESLRDLLSAVALTGCCLRQSGARETYLLPVCRQTQSDNVTHRG